MKKKINVVNKEEMKISLINIPPLFYADKLVDLGNNVYFYNEPLDEYLHNSGMILCAAIKVTFTDGVRNVIIHDSALSKLPKAVQETFINHEVGHFMNGDLENVTAADSMKMIIKRVFGLTPQMEYNADAYAASVVGVSKVKSTFAFMINRTNIPFNTKIELIKRYHKIK